METLVEKFKQFFSAINGGHEPYNWQIRLMTGVAEHGTWPDQIVSPTGSGKTAVIEIHVFLNAYAGRYGIPLCLPRRLCLTVNRRALVDSQYLHAKEISAQLHEILSPDAKNAPILYEVAKGLLSRQGAPSDHDTEDALPLRVDSMHGGTETFGLNREWRSHPEAPMVICSTPDMFGSRLLFRGYGLSHGARPIEAGLLAYDTVLVVDEAHLNRQLVMTARQVKRIEGMSQQHCFPVTPLQVVESTATPPESTDESVTIALTDKDIREDDRLAQRVLAPKHITLREGNKSRSAYIDAIVSAALTAHEQNNDTVSVILNTVAMVTGTVEQLYKHVDPNTVVCVMGRMRPYDRDSVIQRILSRDHTDSPSFIVGTQALEVGIDYDCHTMVTELASAQALVQRIGRVNRFGHYPSSEVIVFDVPCTVKQGYPYDNEELASCKRWMETLPSEGVSSAWIAQHSLPTQKLRRPVLQRLESWDVEYLSHTDEQLAAELGTQVDRPVRETEDSSKSQTSNNGPLALADLTLWLRDELAEDDLDVTVVVRRDLPDDAQTAISVIERVPPLSGEMLPCSIPVLKKANASYSEQESAKSLRAFISDDGISFECTSLATARLHPGSTVILDESEAGLLHPDNSVMAVEMLDIYEEVRTRGEMETPSSLPFILDEHSHLALSESAKEEMLTITESLRREALVWRNDDSRDEEDSPIFSFTNAIQSSICIDSDTKHEIGTPELVFVPTGLKDESQDSAFKQVIIICHPNLSDEQVMGEEIAASDCITLESHARDVANVAESLSTILGILQPIRDDLIEAARRHDDGKADERFQKMLTWSGNASRKPLAKGLPLSRREMKQVYQRLGLTNWRHEQVSAAIAWGDLVGSSIDRSLVTRLIGTSHGHGRDSFALSGVSLTGTSNFCVQYLPSISELYDRGYWEYIVHQTNKDFGYWRMAYLEALLRAADVRVSAGDQLW